MGLGQGVWSVATSRAREVDLDEMLCLGRVLGWVDHAVGGGE